MVQSIVQFFGQEDLLGPKLDAKIAKMVDVGLRLDVSKLRDKEEAQKILRPENCKTLAVPRVNTEIWPLMGRRTRNNDLSFQRIQGLLHKGLTPMLQALEAAKKNKDKPTLQKLGDAFRMLAMASSLISQARKDNIAADLNRMYRPLCTPNRQVTSFLFGDDLQKDLRDIRERNSTGDKLSFYNPKSKFQRGKSGQDSKTSTRGRDTSHTQGPNRPHNTDVEVVNRGEGAILSRPPPLPPL